jgi:replicative DNA helicase
MSQSPLVFTPLEASTAGENYVTFRQKNEGGGMPLYIKNMEYNAAKDDGFMPVMPGELISVIARPGHWKTGFKLRWARERAKYLQEQAALGNETAAKSVVVYVTLEQKVEELRLFQVAAENKISMSEVASGKIKDWTTVTKGLRQLYTSPLWFVGRSMDRRKQKAQMTDANVYTALEEIEKWQDDNQTQIIDSVFVDYLQKFRPTGDFVEYYSGLMNTLSNWAGDFMTRMVVGVQAKREVDRRDTQIPLMDDGQWSSTIEQFSDGVISLVRPCLYPKKEFNGVEVIGTQQLLISCLKRKLGPANFSGWTFIDPKYNILSEAEIKEYNFRVSQGRDE